MIKGLLVGIGIILVYPFIPIVNFTLPISPFISGYVGISFAKSSSASYSVKGLKFGAWLGLIFLLLAGLAAFVATSLVDLSQKHVTLIWMGVGIFTLYTGSMSALGAMFSALRAGRQVSSAAHAEQ